MTAALLLSGVDKTYGSAAHGVRAVRHLDLEVRRGEIIALLGSSGCGKTSTLRMIAGFEEATRGTIAIDGREVHRLPPVGRNVAMAFEGYSLYPPMTIGENIGFALRAKRLPRAEIERRVASVAELLEIGDILGRYPSSVSAGQQQRASLGRALIRDAALHLLDEPLGQLEPQLRTLIRGRLKHFIKERGLTAILVTHDQTEANALADRIAVMEGGELQQYASPAELKDRPANLFTATFIGEPPMNVFEAEPELAGDRLRLRLPGDIVLDYAAAEFAPPVRERVAAAGRVTLGIRAHAVRLAEDGAPAAVTANQWLGDQSHVAASFAGGTLVAVLHERARLAQGVRIGVRLAPADLHLFEGGSGRAIAHGASLA